MMVLFVSQCEKKALKKTRRVLDAFADRIGDSTWQTVITEEGLQAVKKLLRQRASKNTAVSCHWIRSRARSDLLWVVGNKRKFDYRGVVAVNSTMKSEQITEGFALNARVIELLSSLAGFFHDVGKANALFQDKLTGNSDKLFEPYRHEWVSLRVFQAFVNGREDKAWLTDLASVDNLTEPRVLETLAALKDGLNKDIPNPFKVLPPVAKLVAWLIVSHHRLPVWTKESDNPPNVGSISTWRESIFEPCWNSPQCLDVWPQAIIEKNWLFPHGTPMLSVHWQTHVSMLAEKILNHERVFTKCWQGQNYTAHLARLCVMLADHHYSSDKPSIKISPKWQDRNYQAYANTYNDEQGHSKLKQKLDEHNIAVGTYAGQIAKFLPRLGDDLPTLINNKVLSNSTKHQDFVWQNKAYELAREMREDTKRYGFFGVCKASTGKGKTLANARIMYGLSDDNGCRFSIALGLRTLTIQTAKALEKDLALDSGELVMLIGSQAVKELHQNFDAEKVSEQEKAGSESSEPLITDDIEVIQGDTDYSGEFVQWIAHDPKILKLIQSPVLVSTIDYLMPANEGTRGGRQIAPMLRLLTSDLVLDEPDDFSLADMPALCRLVNFSGMLGSRVLLSTATMPPSLVSALFCAYKAGRKHYTEVNGEQGMCDTVCCAWFDEFKQPQKALVSNQQAFEIEHKQFVDKRIAKLKKHALPLRKAKLIDICSDIDKTLTPSQWMANAIRSSIHELHNQHHIIVGNKQVSIGLVRMANINPMVQVSKHLLNSNATNDTILHYCIYHGQLPLVQRSSIEHQLDAALTRKDEQTWQATSNIPAIIDAYSEKHHIFVVLATSVAEVGRDHDYDWAIIEPSSMRSFIQLAGRIQRHRKQEPLTENIHILSTNYKGLKEELPSFCKPGFETNSMQCASLDLHDLDVKSAIENINAIPRIDNPELSPSLLSKDEKNKIKVGSFNALEHLSQLARLFGFKGNNDYSALWWENDVSWCGELQRRQPFRYSQKQEDYCLYKPAHVEGLRWHKKTPKTYPAKYELTDDIAFKAEPLKIEKGNVFWCQANIEFEVNKLAEKLSDSSRSLFQTFTHISLRQHNKNSDEQWQWHNSLGVYQLLKKDRWKHG